MQRFRQLVVCAAIGAAFGGAASAAGYGFSRAGFSAGDDALDVAVPALAVLLIAPLLLAFTVNTFLRGRRGRKIRLAVWFFGRAGHRWYPMSQEVASTDWEAMYRIPSAGTLVGGHLCRDCPVHRIDVRGADGEVWMLLYPITDDPEVEWIAGPMIVREEVDGSQPHWRFRSILFFGAQEDLTAAERAGLSPHLATYPSSLEYTVRKRTSEGFTRVTGFTSEGKAFSAFRLPKPDTDYTRIAGLYAVYCRQQAMPAAPTALASEST